MKTAFIFFGNSTGSAFDIGAAEVLFKNFTPDIVLATSMGSANAGHILKDKNYLKNIEELEELWESSSPKSFFRINKEIFYKFIYAKSIFNNKGLKDLFINKGKLDKRKIEDCTIPLYIGAYDNTNKTTVFFNEGSLIDAVMASCAAPVYFPPYYIDGIEYLDGSMNLRALLDKAIELGSKRIFLVNVALKKRSNSNMISLMRGSFDVLKTAPIEHMLDSKLKRFFIEISPDQDKLPSGFTDYKKTKELIKHGKEKTEKIIKELFFENLVIQIPSNTIKKLTN